MINIKKVNTYSNKRPKKPIILEDVVTDKHMSESLRKCLNSVDYKYSVQEYTGFSPIRNRNTVQTVLQGGIPEIRNTDYCVIRERGKERVIVPICIDDRVLQRTLCDYALLPALEGKLIYDNGASTKDKGVDFARDRTSKFIEDAKRRLRTNELYVLKFDVKSYFDSIPHTECLRVLNELFDDKRLVDLIIGIIESYKMIDINQIQDKEQKQREIERLRNHEYVGICLGSQISQIMALAVLNKFDHYIKDKLGVKFYIRYMDDGIIILDNKEELNRILNLLYGEIERYGLKFNDKKTFIVKASKGFTFLKVKYTITATGKVIKRLDKSGITRMRRKLKKYKNKLDAGEMNMDDIYFSMQSWLAHAKIAHSSHAVDNMMKLYDDMFGGYRLSKKFYKAHPEYKRKKKVTVK